MSKQSQNTPRSSRRFLIDENLGSAKLPQMLRKAGYRLITHKAKYKGKQGILDPAIIADCGKSDLVLLTADSRLETVWASEIELARIAVVILSNNSEGANAWGVRLSTGKKDIAAKLSRYKKPCVLRFGVNARVTFVRLYGPRRARVIKM